MQIFIASLVAKVGEIPNKGLGLIARRDVNKEEMLFTISGKVTENQTRYTIPIAKGVNIDPDLGNGLVNESYYLNHSCDPSAYIWDGGLCRALRDIKEGEEISVHYGILGNFGEEWKREDRLCLCGSYKCYGWVKGYEELSDEEKVELEPFTQEWVKNL